MKINAGLGTYILYFSSVKYVLNITFTLSFHLQKLRTHLLQSNSLRREQVVACLHSESVRVLKVKNQEQSLMMSDQFLSLFTHIGKHLKNDNGQDNVNECF